MSQAMWIEIAKLKERVAALEAQQAPPLTGVRVRRGFGRFEVVDASGSVVFSARTRAEAEAEGRRIDAAVR